MGEISESDIKKMNELLEKRGGQPGMWYAVKHNVIVDVGTELSLRIAEKK